MVNLSTQKLWRAMIVCLSMSSCARKDLMCAWRATWWTTLVVIVLAPVVSHKLLPCSDLRYRPPRCVPIKKLFTIAPPALDKWAFQCYVYGMKFETGAIVTHRDNPRWKAVVIKDIFPRRTTWGMVKVVTLATNMGRGKGFTTTMPKSLLKS